MKKVNKIKREESLKKMFLLFPMRPSPPEACNKEPLEPEDILSRHIQLKNSRLLCCMRDSSDLIYWTVTGVIGGSPTRTLFGRGLPHKNGAWSRFFADPSA